MKRHYVCNRTRYSTEDKARMTKYLYRSLVEESEHSRSPYGLKIWEQFRKENKGIGRKHSAQSLATHFRKYMLPSLFSIERVSKRKIVFIYTKLDLQLTDDEQKKMRQCIPGVTFDSDGHVVSYDNAKESSDEVEDIVGSDADEPMGVAVTARQAEGVEMTSTPSSTRRRTRRKKPKKRPLKTTTKPTRRSSRIRSVSSNRENGEQHDEYEDQENEDHEDEDQENEDQENEDQATEDHEDEGIDVRDTPDGDCRRRAHDGAREDGRYKRRARRACRSRTTPAPSESSEFSSDGEVSVNRNEIWTNKRARTSWTLENGEVDSNDELYNATPSKKQRVQINPEDTYDEGVDSSDLDLTLAEVAEMVKKTTPKRQRSKQVKLNKNLYEHRALTEVPEEDENEEQASSMWLPLAKLADAPETRVNSKPSTTFIPTWGKKLAAKYESKWHQSEEHGCIETDENEYRQAREMSAVVRASEKPYWEKKPKTNTGRKSHGSQATRTASRKSSSRLSCK